MGALAELVATTGNALVAAAGNAPTDWLFGALGAIAFVLVIAAPAALLNARDRKRRSCPLRVQDEHRP